MRVTTSPDDGTAELSVAIEMVCRMALEEGRQEGLEGFAVSRCSQQSYAGVLFASDSRAHQLEVVQETIGEGPGPTAMRDLVPVIVSDLSEQVWAHSWVHFVREAESLGVDCVFAFPVHVGAVLLGLLTVHGDEPVELSDSKTRTLLLLSDTLATVMLAPDPQSGKSGPPWGDGLGTGQAVTHQAVGMVSEQVGVSLEDALLALQGHAFASGASLVEVAEAVVDRRIRWGDAGVEQIPPRSPQPRRGEDTGNAPT